MERLPPGPAKLQGNSHLPSLDGLRGYAVLTVVVSHFFNDKAVPSKLLGEGFGQTGVMIFFALSGFLMCYLYMGKPFDRQHVGDFALRRGARVLPLYFAIVLVSALLTYFFPGRYLLFEIDFADLWKYLLLWDADWVLWTIPVEIQFYMLFPIFWFLWAKSGPSGMLAACGVVILIIAFVNYGNSSALMSQVPVVVPRIQFFIAGMLVCVTYQYLSPMSTRSADVLFVLSLALSVLTAPNVFKLFLGSTKDMWGGAALLTIVAVLLYSSVVSVFASAVFGNPVARFYGNISYSLYLLHVPCISFIKNYTSLDRNVFIFAAVLAVMATAVAYASYVLLEVPSRKFLIRVFADK